MSDDSEAEDYETERMKPSEMFLLIFSDIYAQKPKLIKNIALQFVDITNFPKPIKFRQSDKEICIFILYSNNNIFTVIHDKHRNEIIYFNPTKGKKSFDKYEIDDVISEYIGKSPL